MARQTDWHVCGQVRHNKNEAAEDVDLSWFQKDGREVRIGRDRGDRWFDVEERECAESYRAKAQEIVRSAIRNARTSIISARALSADLLARANLLERDE